MDFFNIPEEEHDSSGFVMRSNDRDKNSNFSKSLIGGYTKGSVERYIQEIKINARQMQENIEFQLQELILEKQSLGQENTLLKSQINDAETRSQEIDSDMARVLESNIEQEGVFLKQQEELLLEINTLQDSLDKSLIDYATIKQELDILTHELQVVKLENQSLQVSFEQRNQSNPEHLLEVENLSSKIIELESQLDSRSKQSEDYEILLHDKNEELATLIYDIDQLKEEIDTLKQSEVASEETIVSLETAMEESLSSITLLNNTITSLEDTNKTLIEKAKFQEIENDRLEKTLGHLQAKIDEQQHKQIVPRSLNEFTNIPAISSINTLPIQENYEDTYEAKRLKEENINLREELKQEILDKFRIEKCLSDDLRRLQLKTDSIISERDSLKYQFEDGHQSRSDRTAHLQSESGLRYQRTLKEQKENEVRKKNYEIAKKIEAIQIKRKNLEASMANFEEEEMNLRYLLEE